MTTNGKDISIVSVPADTQIRANMPLKTRKEYLRYAPTCPLEIDEY